MQVILSQRSLNEAAMKIPQFLALLALCVFAANAGKWRRDVSFVSWVACSILASFSCFLQLPSGRRFCGFIRLQGMSTMSCWNSPTARRRSQWLVCLAVHWTASSIWLPRPVLLAAFPHSHRSLTSTRSKETTETDMRTLVTHCAWSSPRMRKRRLKKLKAMARQRRRRPKRRAQPLSVPWWSRATMAT